MKTAIVHDWLTDRGGAERSFTTFSKSILRQIFFASSIS